MHGDLKGGRPAFRNRMLFLRGQVSQSWEATAQFSTGNMRTAYEYFGIDPYSKCESLARDVQDWSERVYGEAHRLAKKAAPKVP